MRSRWIPVIALLASSRVATAQVTLAFGADVRSPTFFSIAAGTDRRVDAHHAALLSRRVSLDLFDRPLSEALADIERQTGVRFAFGAGVASPSARVTIRVQDLTLVATLTELLLDAGLDVEVRPADVLALVRQRGRDTPRATPAGVGSIAGRVTDAVSGRPIPSATIWLVESNRTAETNDSGAYRIANVPSRTYTLLVRALRYGEVRRPVTVADDQTVTVDVALQRTAEVLDEVVVTATGDQPRREVGNVIAEIQADSLVPNGAVNSFSDLLTARVPGVEVQEANGYTGMSSPIRIRGLNSMTVSNNPIIIVDGARIDNKPGDLGLNGSQNEVAYFNGIWANFGQLSGDLVNINPDEIESIDIVKGPSATTLYGTDAANGVIVIRTKRGQPGHMRVNLYTEQGTVSSTGGLPDNYLAWGHTPGGTPVHCLLVSEAAGQCTIDSVTHFNPFNDPATSPITTGYRQMYGGQLSGGNNGLQYFGSGEYEDERGYLHMPVAEQQRIAPLEGGTVPGYEIDPNIMEKGSFRGNIVSHVGSVADVTITGGLLSNLVRIPASDNIFSAGEYGQGYRDSTDGWNPTYGRPGNIFSLRGDQHITRLTGSTRGVWHPLGWFETHGTVGLDYTDTYLDGLQRYGEGNYFYGQPTGMRWNSRTATTLTSVDLGAKATAHPVGDIGTTTSIGAQYNRTNLGQTIAAGNDLIPGSQSGSGAVNEYVGENTQTDIVAGAYAEQQVSWRDRLFLTGAVRADGSSAFGSHFRTALYPKVSASWVVSQEPFLKGTSSWLSTVRLRAAYGASGVQPDPTAKLSLLFTTNAVIDGQQQSAAWLQTLANNSLKPERQAELEAGFDAEMWRGRVQIEATYYNRQSSDALINLPLAPSAGIFQQEQNIGSIRNRGFEGSIGIQLVSSRLIDVDVRANGSINHNTILSLAPGISNIESSYPFFQQRVGYPLFGIWERPIVSYHTNRQGIVGLNDITIGDTAVYMGSSIPTRQYSFTGAVTLFNGRIRVSSLIDYRGGYRFLDLGEGLFRCQFYANCREVNDPSTPALLQAQAAELDITGAYETISDGTYFRWRELAITLNAPDSWAHAARARTLSVTVSGRNLALWTKVPGLQPERSYSDNTAFADQRFGVPTAPLSRYWLARVNLGL